MRSLLLVAFLAGAVLADSLIPKPGPPAPLPQFEHSLNSYCRVGDIEVGLPNTAGPGVIYSHLEIPCNVALRVRWKDRTVDLSQDQVMALLQFAKTLAPDAP